MPELWAVVRLAPSMFKPEVSGYTTGKLQIWHAAGHWQAQAAAATQQLSLPHLADCHWQPE